MSERNTRAILPVSADLVRQALGLPETTQIVGMQVTPNGSWQRQIELLIEDPELAELCRALAFPVVQATFVQRYRKEPSLVFQRYEGAPELKPGPPTS